MNLRRQGKLWLTAAALGLFMAYGANAATDLSADNGDTAVSLYSEASRISASWDGVDSSASFATFAKSDAIFLPPVNLVFAPAVVTVPVPEPGTYAAAVSVCAFLGLLGVRRNQGSNKFGV